MSPYSLANILYYQARSFVEKKYFDAEAADNRMIALLDRFADMADPQRARQRKLLASLELQQFVLSVQDQVLPPLCPETYDTTVYFILKNHTC